jgi:hypothetical protein
LIVTGLTNFVADWNNSGTLLAVAGSRKDNSPRGLIYDNRVKFYNDEGRLVYNISVPSTGVRQLKVLLKATLSLISGS